MGRYGTSRLSKVGFLSGVPPYLLRANDNPQGVPQAVFAQIEAGIRKDHLAFLTGFFQTFYNLDQLGDRISDEVVRDSWMVAACASPVATLACVKTWGTDFRKDLGKVDVPTLVMQGDADRIVPIDASGRRTHQRVKSSVLVEIPGAPHGFLATHAAEANRALLDFIGSDQAHGVSAHQGAATSSPYRYPPGRT